MRFLHVLLPMNGVYTNAIVKFFSDFYWQDEHDFLIYINDVSQKIDPSICGHQLNIKYCFNYRMIARDIWVHEAEYTYIVHHFFPNDLLLNAYYAFWPHAADKVVWVVWGADLYNWKRENKWFLINGVRKVARSKVPYIVSGEMDRDSFYRIIGAPRLYCSNVNYPRGYDKALLDREKIKNESDNYRIMVGHSASKALNHVQIIEKLQKYREKGIKLIIPLNYGDSTYAEEVSRYAMELFGEHNVEVVTNSMAMPEYVRLLWTCDAAVFHTDRQIALGNILMLFYMGKKIFLRKSSVMKKNFDSMNLETFNSDDIGEMDYLDLIRPVSCPETNRAFALEQFEPSATYLKWSNLFKKLEA